MKKYAKTVDKTIIRDGVEPSYSPGNSREVTMGEVPPRHNWKPQIGATGRGRDAPDPARYGTYPDEKDDSAAQTETKG